MATYLATSASIPVLRRRFATADSFRTPGGVAIPVAATVVGLGLLASASWTDLVAGALAALAGAVIYLLRRSD